MADPHTAPDNKQFDLVNILAPGGSPGHLDHDDSGSSMATRPQVSDPHGLWWTWPLVQATAAHVVLSRSLDLVVTVTLGRGKGYPDLHCPYGSMVPRSQHSPRWWPKPLKSAQSSMARGAMDLNPDPGYYRTRDSDMARIAS